MLIESAKLDLTVLPAIARLRHFGLARPAFHNRETIQLFPVS